MWRLTEDWLSVPEAADKIGIHTSTLKMYFRRRRRKLGLRKIGKDNRGWWHIHRAEVRKIRKYRAIILPRGVPTAPEIPPKPPEIPPQPIGPSPQPTGTPPQKDE